MCRESCKSLEIQSQLLNLWICLAWRWLSTWIRCAHSAHSPSLLVERAEEATCRHATPVSSAGPAACAHGRGWQNPLGPPQEPTDARRDCSWHNPLLPSNTWRAEDAKDEAPQHPCPHGLPCGFRLLWLKNHSFLLKEDRIFKNPAWKVLETVLGDNLWIRKPRKAKGWGREKAF